MLTLCGKPFTVSEDGATTIEQCILCEQPELIVAPGLLIELAKQYTHTEQRGNTDV